MSLGFKRLISKNTSL